MEQIVYKDRRGTNSVKWDILEEKYGDPDLVSLWVADMDFQVPECVRQSLREYIEQGTFGYYKPSEGYLEAFIQWEKTCHEYDVQKEWLRFAPGVVPALNWLVQILTEPGDGVAVMTPVYYPFMGAVQNNGRTLVDCPLRCENGIYTMDLEKFEQLAAAGKMKLFILCSPHNPVGRVWTKEELTRLMAICEKYQIMVLADEIHQDIVTGDKKKTTAATVSAYAHNIVTVTAASKTFNLAALQNSLVMIPDEEIRVKWDRFTEQIRVTDGNAMGYIAVQSAYENGRPWLDQVLDIIRGNFVYMRDTLQEALPEIVIAPLEGTYLMWIDLGAYVSPHQMEEVVQKKARMAVDFGDWFGGEHYATCIRVNLATSRENIEKAARQLIEAVKEQQ